MMKSLLLIQRSISTSNWIALISNPLVHCTLNGNQTLFITTLKKINILHNIKLESYKNPQLLHFLFARDHQRLHRLVCCHYVKVTRHKLTGLTDQIYAAADCPGEMHPLCENRFPLPYVRKYIHATTAPRENGNTTGQDMCVMCVGRAV